MGKARRFLNRRREENDVGAINRNVNALNNFSGFPERKPTSFSTNSFLQTTGGILSGSIGFESQSLTLATGVLTLTSNTTEILTPKKIVYVSVESGTSDTLTKINTNGNELAGQSLILVGNNATHTITISHDISVSGNDKPILCPSNTSFTLSGDNAIELFYDSTNSKWVIIGNTGTGGGGGGVSYPLTPSVNVVGNVASGTTTIDLSASNAHSTTFTATGDSTLAFSNYPASGNQIEWEVEITQDATGGRTITMPSEVVEDPGIVTTANTTSVLTFRTNDGGTTVHVVSLLNASPTAISGATKELDNLTTTALNTDIHMGTFDIDELDRLVFDKSVGNTLGTTDTGITSNTLGDMVFNLNGTSASYDFVMNNDSVIRLQINNNTVVSQSLFPVDSSADTLGGAGGEWNTGHIKQITVGGAQKGIDNIGELKFVNNTLTPSGNGIFYFDGTDVKVRTGSVTKNLSNISSTTGATIELDNLGTTAVNANIIPDTDVTYNLGSPTLRWGTLYNSSIDASGVLTVAGNTVLNGNVNIGNNGSVDTVSFYSKLDTNFDMNSFDIQNTDRLLFSTTGTDNLSSTDYGIGTDSTNSDHLHYNTPSGKDHRFDVAGSLLLSINGVSGTTVQTGLWVAGSLTATGNVSFQQSVDIGNSSSDSLTVTSSIDSDLIPSGTRSLGSSSNEWQDLRINGIAYIDQLDNIGDIIVNADLDFSTGKYPDLTDTSTIVSTGTRTIPDAEGFVKIKVNGAIKKIPYFS